MPVAWRKAFDAARDKRVTATGDLLLGINAHVNRDLPFVLAGMGLVRPGGESGKPDFDKANEFLDAASDAMMAELAARFDPTVDDVNDPLGLAYGTVMQMLTTMREGAWRNAEALVNAPTAQARALVAPDHRERARAAFANTILLLLRTRRRSPRPPRVTPTAPRTRAMPRRWSTRSGCRRRTPAETPARPRRPLRSSRRGLRAPCLHVVVPALCLCDEAETSRVTEADLPQPSVAVSVTV